MTVEDARVDRVGQIDDLFKVLLKQTQFKVAAKRAQFTIPFILSKDMIIGVQGYSLVSETRKGAIVYVDRSGRDVQEVKSVVTYEDKVRRTLS